MRISRHARNNMRLYKIGEEDILETTKFPDYPLKVVYNEEENFIITVYPLKKKKWR